MKNTTRQFCHEWADVLAARHPDDLTPEVTHALHEHLEVCVPCSTTYASYALIKHSIRSLPTAKPLSALPALPPQEIRTKEKQMRLVRRQRQTYGNGSVQTETLMTTRAAKNRKSRITEIAGMVASVLVVVLIIGSSLLLFSHRSTTGHTQIQQQTKQPSLTNNCASLEHFTPSLYQFCLGGLFTHVHASKVIAGYAITIERIYADSSLIVVGYTSQKQLGDTRQYTSLATSTITVQQKVIYAATGTPIPSIPGTNTETIQYLVFDASRADIPLDIKKLSVHLDASISYPQDAYPGQHTIGHAIFDFPTIPFNASMYTLAVNQTTISKGVSVTLEKVSITASQTRMYILVSASTLDEMRIGLPQFTLMIDGVTMKPYEASFDTTSSYVIFSYPLFSKHGVWTLQIQIQDIPSNNGGNKDWTFHFIVPQH